MLSTVLLNIAKMQEITSLQQISSDRYLTHNLHSPNFEMTDSFTSAVYWPYTIQSSICDQKVSQTKSTVAVFSAGFHQDKSTIHDPYIQADEMLTPLELIYKSTIKNKASIRSQHLKIIRDMPCWVVTFLTLNEQEIV